MGGKRRRRKTAEKRIDRSFLAIVLLALVVRLVYLHGAAGSPGFLVPTVDSATYDAFARQLAFEGTLTPRIFWQGILYPLWLALAYLLTGGSILGAKILQALMGALLCGMVCRAAAGITGRRAAGPVAGGITALYGPLVFFEGELLATGLAALLSILLLWALLRARAGLTPSSHALAGVIGGLAVLARATFAPFLAAGAVWLLMRGLSSGLSRRRVAALLSAAAAGFVLVTLPVALLSYTKTGLFTPLAHSGPINLYIGNNPDAEETIMIRPGSRWRELTMTPMVEGSQDDIEDRRYFTGLFVDYVKGRQGEYVRGLLSKTVQYLSSRELPRNVDVYVARDHSPLLAVLVWRAGRFGFPFGLLLPLALIGLVMERRRMPAPVHLYLLLYSAAVILVFAAARYRAATVPVLAIPAAAGALHVVDALRAGRWARAAALAGGSAIIGVLMSIAGPFAAERHDYRAEMHCTVGYELMKRGRISEATAELDRCLQIDPRNGDAHKFLGLIASGRRMHERALRHFELALERDTDSYLIRYYTGVSLLNLGRRDEAAVQLEEALAGAREHREERLVGIIEGLLGGME